VSKGKSGVNDIAGHPGNWPATSRDDPSRPVPVSGVWLRGDGKDIVVAVEVNGKWVDVIREYAANTDTISHIVEPAGIRAAAHEEQP
jgi:hypothetical protein